MPDIGMAEWSPLIALFYTPHFALGLGLEVIVFTCVVGMCEVTSAGEGIRWAVFGAIAAILAGGANVILPLFNIKAFPFATLGVSMLTIFVGAAILRYNLFLFKPMVEHVLEKKSTSPKIYELESSKSYVIQEVKEVQGYKIFKDQTTHSISGLCVTKYPPYKISARQINHIVFDFISNL